MADSLLFPDNAAAKFRQLEDRVRVLESSNRLLSSTIRGGKLSIQDAAGVSMAELGYSSSEDVTGAVFYDTSGNPLMRVGTNVNGVGGEGVNITDSNGNSAVRVSDAGLILPLIIHPLNPYPGYTSQPFVVTSGTFVDVLQSHVLRVSADSVSAHIKASADAGTAGEVRITHSGGGATSVLPITSTGFVDPYIFDWLHGAALYTNTVFTVQARRTSGAGEIQIWESTTGVVVCGQVVFLATASGI